MGFILAFACIYIVDMMQLYHLEMRAVVITYKRSHKIRPMGTPSQNWAELLGSFLRITETCSCLPLPFNDRNPACHMQSWDTIVHRREKPNSSGRLCLRCTQQLSPMLGWEFGLLRSPVLLKITPPIPTSEETPNKVSLVHHQNFSGIIAQLCLCCLTYLEQQHLFTSPFEK